MAELKEQLDTAGLDNSGVKAVLVERLVEHYASTAAAPVTVVAAETDVAAPVAAAVEPAPATAVAAQEAEPAQDSPQSPFPSSLLSHCLA